MMTCTNVETGHNNQSCFENNFRALLEWIAVKTDQMRRRSFANSLEGVQNDVRLFKVYMTREKPPKCQEKVNLEANFFEIEMKLKELRQNPFVPPEGQRLPDIDQVRTLQTRTVVNVFQEMNLGNLVLLNYIWQSC